MNRRAFIAGLTATAAGLLIPSPERKVWALDQTMVKPIDIPFYPSHEYILWYVSEVGEPIPIAGNYQTINMDKDGVARSVVVEAVHYPHMQEGEGFFDYTYRMADWKKDGLNPDRPQKISLSAYSDQQWAKLEPEFQRRYA